MLITIILISFGVWGCAYLAVHRFPGRMAYWALYIIAAGVVPGIFCGAFWLLGGGSGPEAAPDIVQTLFGFGVILGVLAFPFNHTRIKAKQDAQD